MDWLRRMMMGRAGVDQLSIALMVVYFLMSSAGQWSRWTPLRIFAAVPLVVAFYRIFSRDTGRRYAENSKFMTWWGPAQNWILQRYNRIRWMKTHRYFDCPNCKQTVRVPRGKGKISITCPKCKTDFIKKT